MLNVWGCGEGNGNESTAGSPLIGKCLQGHRWNAEVGDAMWNMWKRTGLIDFGEAHRHFLLVLLPDGPPPLAVVRA